VKNNFPLISLTFTEDNISVILQFLRILREKEEEFPADLADFRRTYYQRHSAISAHSAGKRRIISR
jgi:hypothetical protein